ncbi:MAG: Thiol-disulfide oxidoreductase ResA [Calditrichaeota bacterium]|nr:Thiol-disulfide oxidoreductase ResA [Calditrichota bacterium]
MRLVGVWKPGAIVLAGLLLIPAVLTAKEGELTIGERMPGRDLMFRNVDGSTVRLSDVKGERGTLVIITCNHCPFVKAWEQRTVALANKAQEDGYGVIALNPNDPSEYEEESFEANVRRAAAAGMNYPYAVDKGSKLAAMYGATRTPEFFLFDENDMLIYHGAIDDNAQDPERVRSHYLMDALIADMNGDPIEPAETKSVGCSIKWYGE